MGKKKPFIDKKTSSVYHVVRRSQRDVGTEATAETLSDFVLMPSPENAIREERRALQNATSDKETATHAANAAAAASSNHPPSRKKGPVNFTSLKTQIARAGLLDQTATTYSKYTKPIQGSGTFIPSSDDTTDNWQSSGEAASMNELLTDTSKNALDSALEEAMAVHEVGRMLDSIALTTDCMEEDVARALFEEYEEEEFEEILDDFCFTANLENEDEDDEHNGEFNFEEHIRQMMEKARAKDSGIDEDGRELENDFFSGQTPLHVQRAIGDEDYEEDYEEDFGEYGEYEEGEDEDEENEDEDEDSLDREFNGENTTTNITKNDEQQRILCQKFEETLLEYDSDEMGDLDDECDEIVGSRPLEGDAQLEAALNEFLTEKEDDVLVEGTRHLEEYRRCGGSGYSALVGKSMVHASELFNGTDIAGGNIDVVAGGVEMSSKSLLINIEESKKQMQKDLEDADAILANPEMDLPPEEILIDGKSYFTARTDNPWDCESILSTYSNLDNNPVVIGRSKKRGKNKKKGRGVVGGLNEEESNVIPEDAPVKIQLSSKTGLPLGVFDNNDDDHHHSEHDYYGYNDESDTFLSINRGEARNKKESNDEKKARKFAIKEERRICRMQKKMMKEAFKDEFQKRISEGVVDAVGGATVFRLS